MAEILLQTKLFVPPKRPFLISRPHLITKLNEGLMGKLTLASAPAGFGKTTLISTWLNQLAATHKTAWLSLDESDNDPVRFFAYFIGALQTVETAVGQSLANTSQLPPAEVAMQLLLPEITAVSHPFILVLDDYHLINTPDIHKAIETLLTYSPPQMHLVIISRADPPFSLSKLRVRRQLTEIRARDLRFTPDEATEFLNQIMGLFLSPQEVSLLEKRTEGWIGGLQLAAHSLQMEADKTAFLTAFAGDDRYIADYLLEEVLASQPEAIQSFLLQSSILPRLSAPLCNAILERQDSQTILEFLEQSNLFIVPLDNRRQWYRYHHLFADLLRDRLEAASGSVRQLHQRASQWHIDNQQLQEAVEHALLAADYERAIALILDGAIEIFMGSRLLTLLPWWQKLPEAWRTQNLTLLMMMAWAWLATGHLHESEQGLQMIEQTLGSSTSALLADIDKLESKVRNGLIEVVAIRMSRQTAVSFNASERLTLCQRILPFLVPEETIYLFTPLFVLRPVALFNMGLSYQLLGQMEAAVQAFTEAMEQGKAFGNVHIVASSLGHLAEIQIEQGQLHQAADTCQRGLETLDALAGKSSPMSGLLHVQLGELFYEWGDWETAVHHYQEGIALAQPWQNKETLLPGYAGLARAYHALAQPQQAQEAQKAYAELAGAELASTEPTSPQAQAVLPPAEVYTLVEPLSERELEVLSLIAEGLTNQEIALRLHLSLGTVKVHAHNIYGKLDVNGRTQAVAKARSLHLIES